MAGTDNKRVRKLYFDTLLRERYKGKPLVIRYAHRVDYLSGGTGAVINIPVPVNVSLVNSTIIRLEYMDGAVEHWKVIPGIIDCIKNYYKFGSLNRNLLWWNKKGIGSFFMTSYKHGGYESYKAWNYSDSAKEPVYK